MRGIRRPAEFEEMVRRLAEEPHPACGKAIFATMRELVCFAAALGFQVKRRVPIDGPTNEIDARIFERSETAMDLLYLIALSEEKQSDVLMPDREEQATRIFEEYVAGGLAEIREWTLARPEDQYGDQALLTGLLKSGLLKASDPEVDDVLSQVHFDAAGS